MSQEIYDLRKRRPGKPNRKLFHRYDSSRRRAASTTHTKKQEVVFRRRCLYKVILDTLLIRTDNQGQKSRCKEKVG